MTDDRESFRVARVKGKAKTHEKRLESATYTAAEVKVLTEAALRLGRKEALDEAAEAIKSHPGPDPSPASAIWWDGYGEAQRDMWRIVIRMDRQPSPDATSGRTGPEGCITCEQQSKGGPNG